MVVVVLVVVFVFLILVGAPFLVALGELLLVVLLALSGIVARVLFRRPWTVDAVDPDGGHRHWHVVGWRSSGAARQLVADRIAATGTTPSAAEVSAAVGASR